MADDDMHGSTELAPISRERIQQLLADQSFQYFIDSDGDLGGFWDDHRFYFFFYGPEQEVLQIRGYYKRELAITARPTVLSVIDDFHRDKIWPKLFTRIDGDDLKLYSEHSFDFEPGATDAQLLMMIRCAIGTSLEAFEYFDTTLFGPGDSHDTQPDAND